MAQFVWDAAEATLDRLTENADVVMIRYRLTEPTGIDFVSRSSERILGYRPEEFYADSMLGLAIVHPDDRERLEETCSRDPETPFVGRAVRKDGTVRWIERRQILVDDGYGQPRHLEATLRDISPVANGKLGSEAQLGGAGLTPRQLEILRMLSAGDSTDQIANELCISRETVRNHVRHILRALHVHSRLAAVAKARTQGLVGD
ncbi:MAG TPA: LuxR C-terminal-related transcriptional regulator [Gaiellaceae bacterium]|nr:LuxR C-terminal-related transcriptional regulator [Gaiellaceae bacterium]